MIPDAVSQAIARLREHLIATAAHNHLGDLELLALELEEAESRYRALGGPAGREDVFAVVRRMNQLSMLATGQTLTNWRSPPRAGQARPPDRRDVGSAVVLCRAEEPPTELATGFVINAVRGYLLTCRHFASDERQAFVADVSGLQLAADRAFASSDLDLAVMELRGGAGVPDRAIPRPEAASRLQSGDEISCFGRRPQGYLAERTAHVANPSVRLRVHHVTCPVAELDSTMHPGFSGGPALDRDGAFRGVVVARITEVGGVKEGDVAILVPAEHVLKWISSLEEEVGHVIWEP